MKIDLVRDSKPFTSPSNRAVQKTRELEQPEIDEQLKAGVFEAQLSEWSAPDLFVPKKDGKFRFCIDYRNLNAMTVKDKCLLPRLDECIDKLVDSQLFTTLDAYSGYWQINIRKKYRQKKAFICHAGTVK